MPCRPSTSTSRVRRPAPARARASAHATGVFPVPPLPVTMCRRAGQRSFTPAMYLLRGRGDVAKPPAVVGNGGERETLGADLLVTGGQVQRRGDRRLGRRLAGDGRRVPRVVR